MHLRFKYMARNQRYAILISMIFWTEGAFALSGYEDDINQIKQEQFRLEDRLDEHAEVSRELAALVGQYEKHAVAQQSFFEAQISEIAACKIQMTEYDIIAEEVNNGEWTDLMMIYVEDCFRRTADAKQKVEDAAGILGRMEKEVKRLRFTARVRARDANGIQASLNSLKARQAELQARIDFEIMVARIVLAGE